MRHTESVKEVKLNVGVALVDDADYDAVADLTWRLHKPNPNGTPYAVHSYRVNGAIRMHYMHRFVLKLPPRRPLVDHWDGDGLNNQRHNLRVATISQNGGNAKLYNTNTSGYKNVSWHPEMESWYVSVRANGQRKRLYGFATPELANEAAIKLRQEMFGTFARDK